MNFMTLMPDPTQHKLMKEVAERLNDMATNESIWLLMLSRLGIRTVVYNDMWVNWREEFPYFTIPSYAPMANQPKVGDLCVIGNYDAFILVEVYAVINIPSPVITSGTLAYKFRQVNSIPDTFFYPEGWFIFEDFYKRYSPPLTLNG